MEVHAARSFNLLFVWLDLGWLALFIGLLLYFKKYQALIVGLVAGIVYMIVDYGIFYLALGTRTVTGADPFWLLLWLSMSYGLTNFAWIWLLFDRDGHWKEWSVLVIAGWLAVAFLSQNFGVGTGTVTTGQPALAHRHRDRDSTRLGRRAPRLRHPAVLPQCHHRQLAH
jgi:hypothetical protein